MVNSRWLNTNGTGDSELEQEIASNRNKLAKCYDNVTLDGQDLTLSNELSGISTTIGLPSGSGSGSFTAHNSVSTTGRQIIFGLSTGGNHAANMYPSNWESDIENSVKTIVLDGTSIRAKRHDNSLTGEIAWANPTHVSTLQTDLQSLEDDVNDKCVKTIEIRDGVLKGKRIDGSFTGSVDVILTTTLDAAVSTYLGTTLYKTLTELQTLGFKTLTEIQTLGYKTLTELETLGYYTLSQIQALNYITKTTSSSWTSNAFINLSTDTHNQEVSCNFSKRSGLKANNPSPNDYAQPNATNIELWNYSDSAGLAGAGGFHFNTNLDRLAVANIPASSECFNHHLDVKCRDFYLNFNVTKWLPNTVSTTWEWQNGLTTIVLFCKPSPPSQGITNWLAAAPGNNYDYPLVGIPRSGIHIQIEANSSFDDHDTYGGQTKSVEIGHYDESTFVSWGHSGSATNGVGLADAVSYDVTIQAKRSRLLVRIQPQGVPRGAATSFGTDATQLFTFVMPTEFGTTLATADTTGRLFYTNGGNILFNTNQNIELSHLKILSEEV